MYWLASYINNDVTHLQALRTTTRVSNLISQTLYNRCIFLLDVFFFRHKFAKSAVSLACDTLPAIHALRPMDVPGRLSSCVTLHPPHALHRALHQLLLVRPGAPSSFLLLVAMPFAPGSEHSFMLGFFEPNSLIFQSSSMVPKCPLCIKDTRTTRNSTSSRPKGRVSGNSLEGRRSSSNPEREKGVEM